MFLRVSSLRKTMFPCWDGLHHLHETKWLPTHTQKIQNLISRLPIHISEYFKRLNHGFQTWGYFTIKVIFNLLWEFIQKKYEKKYQIFCILQKCLPIEISEYFNRLNQGFQTGGYIKHTYFTMKVFFNSSCIKYLYTLWIRVRNNHIGCLDFIFIVVFDFSWHQHFNQLLWKHIPFKP